MLAESSEVPAHHCLMQSPCSHKRAIPALTDLLLPPPKTFNFSRQLGDRNLRILTEIPPQKHPPSTIIFHSYRSHSQDLPITNSLYYNHLQRPLAQGEETPTSVFVHSQELLSHSPSGFQMICVQTPCLNLQPHAMAGFQHQKQSRSKATAARYTLFPFLVVFSRAKRRVLLYHVVRKSCMLSLPCTHLVSQGFPLVSIALHSIKAAPWMDFIRVPVTLPG